ncbi:MAG TPA: response regulator [Thermoanaerobaculia bacterium]|nr:response regulator [Thermoanaerobaculia bacterium]
MPEPLSILVVEDSPEDRALYRRLLGKGGEGAFRVAEEDTGERGLARLAAERFDCLLLDYQLPDLDGLEFLAALATADVAERPAVILLTGHGDESIAVEAMRRGAQDYLDKGRVSGERLLRSVRHAVERVGLERRVAEHARELQRAHDRLEEQVAQRTAQLEATNEELRREIAVRQRAEEEKAELLVREREARREAEAANRLKDEFLATLSHELRTPLNAILGWAAILVRPGLDRDTVQRAAEVIERNSRAQAQLVSDLLDVSGIITGKTRLELGPVDVGAVVERVVESVLPAAEGKRIELAVDVAPELPAIVADPARLQQVIWNLVANAVKFTGEEGHVRVAARRDGDGIEVEVTDDGPGIPAEFLPFVFERFRQRDSSTTRAHGGLGLGLAIVRHLVELHGGSVAAESAGEGSGSSFRVRLPARLAAPAGGGEPAARAAASLAGVKVLVVEDEPDTRELCRVLLEAEGARVQLSASAESALAEVERFRPDVVLSDIGLPGEDGYSFLRRLRALPADRGGAVPAAAMTAYAGEADVDRARQVGYALHLAKPVTPDHLIATVAELARAAAHP